MIAAIDLNLHLLLPEFIVLGAALGAIVTELLLPPGRRAVATTVLAMGGLVVSLIVLLASGAEGTAMHITTDAGETLAGWQADGFGIFCRATVLVGGILLLLLSAAWIRRLDRGHGEFNALLLFALAGVMLCTGVADLLNLFVALELVTITAFILAAFKRNDLRSTEAGLKYLVVGAVSTALLLLGIALIYGRTGHLDFAGIAGALQAEAGEGGLLLLWLGIALLVGGLLFKLGGVPFHVWIPDVYQGAPAPVTAFLATASKAVGVILAIRVSATVLAPAQGLLGFDDPAIRDAAISWVAILATLAALTLLVGTLAAIPQRNMKRMLGYSSVGHAGYLLMGMAAIASGAPGVGSLATTALLYYLLAYIVTGATAFAVVVVVSGARGGTGDNAFAGLSERSPLLAVAMCLALLSLAGVPPMSGFFGKFLVLTAAVKGELIAVALVGALGVVISLYFYLCWIWDIYMRPAETEGDGSVTPIRTAWSTTTVLWIGMVGMLAMGIFQTPFYGWASTAAKALFH